MTYPFHDGSPKARDAALSACASCGTARAACFTRADAGGDQCCEQCRHVPDPDTAGPEGRCWRSECRTACYYPEACSVAPRPSPPVVSPDTGREALAAERETLRRSLIAAQVTDTNDTYGDGYAAGLAQAITALDRLAALSRSPERATAERCRYCKSALTDEQERRWGICSACHDEGSRG